jgi:serine/threonine protein kinase
MVARPSVILVLPVSKRYGQSYIRFFAVLIVDRCQVPVTEAITYGSLRWLAPELVADSSYIPTTRATDVWSFGMLSLEIFTDSVPFSHVSDEAFLPLVIRDGPLPTRPEHANTRGLSDAMWNLIEQCWQRDPKSRPSMSDILALLVSYHQAYDAVILRRESPRRRTGKLRRAKLL